MYRTHNCGELKMENVGERVILSGWVQKSRDLGGMTFVDLRDRYGLTQLVFNMESDAGLCGEARKLGREFVLKVEGMVAERSNKNLQISTGHIEILVDFIRSCAGGGMQNRGALFMLVLFSIACRHYNLKILTTVEMTGKSKLQYH